jgi:hypothetical protein
MSDEEKIASQVAELFDRLIHNQAIEDVKQLADSLPNNPAALAQLAARCRQQSLKTIRAGHHTEGRRLEILGRQLQERISDSSR